MTTHPTRARMSGPLKPFKAGFADELLQQGYTRNSARQQLHLMAHLSRWLDHKGLKSQELTQDELSRFLDARRASGYTNYLTDKAVRPLLTYLRSLGAAPPQVAWRPQGPSEELQERFRVYLTAERGLVPAAARGYVDAVRPFIHGRLSPDGLDLENLCAADVTAFVVSRCPEQGCGTAKLTVCALRSLLGYLHLEGTIEAPLSAAVPAIAARRLAGLPKGLGPSEVRSLLKSCDRRTANGRRDFAVLTVLVRLGLRAGEVARVEIEDFDWRAGEIAIHGKGRRVEKLPLPDDVGEAVAAYLRRGRPATAQGRATFVRVKAPHSALTTGGVTQIVAAAARRAGLGRIHAHRLRHTAATEMLRAGAPLTEIGQLLRHRRLMTTAIYAKVDREALRTIARAWPGGGE